MRRSLNLILCAASFITPLVAAAQSKFCPAPPPSPFKHSGQIATRFDPSSDAMRTTLQHPRPVSTPHGKLYLSASFVHGDQRREGDRPLELVLVAASKHARYGDNHTLALFGDGSPITFMSAARYQTGAGDGPAVKFIKVVLSGDELASLILARKVTGRIGKDEFELSNNHLEALRELASLMAGPTPRWRAE